MIALLTGFSIAAAVLFAALALRPRDRHLAAGRIAELSRGDSSRFPEPEDTSASFDAGDGRLSAEVQRWVPPSLLASIRRSLTAAGDPASVVEFVSIATLLGVALAAIPP